MELNTTISLKLYAFGINKLHDPNWTGIDLYDNLKQHVRGRNKPYNMLFETIPNGLLYHLGRWMYEEYFEHSRLSEEEFNDIFPLEGEYLLWYIEDYMELLKSCGIDKFDELFIKVKRILDNYGETFLKDEVLYFKELKKNEDLTKRYIYNLSETYCKQISEAKDIYSNDFAERVLHDRILCEFISNLILNIGFDGSTEEKDYSQKWVERKNFPSWAKKTIISRERGHCADCGASIILELEDNYHFDHIMPLYQGGTNDLSNFQLLCQRCNLSKSKNLIPVKSSIPRYLKFSKKK